MSTRSTITATFANGQTQSVYCHSDGYPSYVGAILRRHYTGEDQLRALLALGDLSSLGENCTAPAGHSFDNPVPGHVVAYHRDRGEQFRAPRTAKPTGDNQEAYNYSWEKGVWACADRDGRVAL